MKLKLEGTKNVTQSISLIMQSIVYTRHSKSNQVVT